MDPLWRSRLFSSAEDQGQVSRLGLFKRSQSQVEIGHPPSLKHWWLYRLYSLRSTPLHYDDVGVLPACQEISGMLECGHNKCGTCIPFCILGLKFSGNPSPIISAAFSKNRVLVLAPKLMMGATPCPRHICESFPLIVRIVRWSNVDPVMISAAFIQSRHQHQHHIKLPSKLLRGPRFLVPEVRYFGRLRDPACNVIQIASLSNLICLYQLQNLKPTWNQHDTTIMSLS